MTAHPETAPFPAHASLVSRLREAVVGYPVEECDPPAGDAVARAAEFLVRLERERPDLVEGTWIGVGRDGSIEIDISLTNSIVGVLTVPDDERFEVMFEQRATGSIEDALLTTDEVIERLEPAAA